MRISILITAILSALAGTAALAEAATVETHVLIVTNNAGSGLGRPDLQYADDDGAKYHELFSMFAPADHVTLLTRFDRDTARLFPQLAARAKAPTKANLIAAAQTIAEQTRRELAAGHSVQFYFVFAGHGDVDRGRGFIELEDAPLHADELRTHVLAGVPATSTHLIADSCNSFFLVHARKPGGRRFATPTEAIEKLARELPHVGVFLSTNAESEVFEWSEIQSGIFSHAVRSGLAGAADADGNHRIDYDELEAFVNTAVAEVRNPQYRPRVFAKAPERSQQLTRFSPSSAVAVRIEPGLARRLTIRDAEGLAWVDLHKESDSDLLVSLPERLATGAWIDELTVDARGSHLAHRYRIAVAEPQRPVLLASLEREPVQQVARGPGAMFKSLFRRPFGALAQASYEQSRTQTPAPVYGISKDDSERMRLLLTNIGDIESGNRRRGAAGLLLAGGLSLAFGGWMLSRDDLGEGEVAMNRGIGLALLAGGGAGVIGGGIAMFRRSQAERLRDGFDRGVARGDDPAQVVMRTEKELGEVADSYRSSRTVTRWLSYGLVATGGSLVVLNELQSQPDAFNRFAFGGLATVGLFGIMITSSPHPIERMVSLWDGDPGIRRLPRLTVSPIEGGALVGLGGEL